MYIVHHTLHVNVQCQSKLMLTTSEKLTTTESFLLIIVVDIALYVVHHTSMCKISVKTNVDNKCQRWPQLLSWLPLQLQLLLMLHHPTSMCTIGVYYHCVTQNDMITVSHWTTTALAPAMSTSTAIKFGVVSFGPDFGLELSLLTILIHTLYKCLVKGTYGGGGKCKLYSLCVSGIRTKVND